MTAYKDMAPGFWMPFVTWLPALRPRLVCPSRGRIPVSKTNPAQRRVEDRFEVFYGIDVARKTHYAVVLDRRGWRLIDRPLPNAESDLLKLFGDLEAHGRVLVVVDQLARLARWLSRSRAPGPCRGLCSGLGDETDR